MCFEESLNDEDEDAKNNINTTAATNAARKLNRAAKFVWE